MNATLTCRLTPRQRQVAKLIAEGFTKPEIAIFLSIGVTTVKAHTDAIFERLGARNRANAVYLALKLEEIS